MPKVLISDELSDAAVQIFRDRGVEVDFQPKLGKDAARLAPAVIYLNRLSDWLFTLARAANHRAGIEDVPWKSGKA